MVEITGNAQRLLNRLTYQYCDFRRRGEYGTSSFWNWYYQIRNYVYSLDKYTHPLGEGLTYSMPIWGDIEFSRIIIGGEICVFVTDFKFNSRNFFNWILYNILPPKPSTLKPEKLITSWDFDRNYESYDGIYVVVSNNGLYSLTDVNKKLLINKWFTDIVFPKVKDVMGFDTIGQGCDSVFNYLITTNLRVVHPAEVAITNRRKIESVMSLDNIITEIINCYLRENLLPA